MIVSRAIPDTGNPEAEPFFGLKVESRPAPGSLHAYGAAGKPRSLWVATGTNPVAVLELQPAGKKRMSADEFLRGHPIADGALLGAEVPA